MRYVWDYWKGLLRYNLKNIVSSNFSQLCTFHLYLDYSVSLSRNLFYEVFS